ncbi:transglutaminase domain-containing protein [[Kitasatospora] papulosa]|uniref:transglutaminase domain-containing protein n=1 Tax=[Kitasatospora] papulosa TaxID=1464011 RepID=UPI002E34BECB|nr:transglutaminase domain-containing protein [[Kitasatospora] papulosa]
MDTLQRVTAPLFRIPFEHRCYETSPEDAERDYGIGPELLRQLRALGLPSIGEGALELFDGLDLSSVSLHLGLPSVRRFVLSLWPRTLRQMRAGPVAYTVTVDATCPTPQHPGKCRYLVATGEEEGKLVISDTPRVNVASFDIDVEETPRPVPNVLRSLVDDFSDVQFYLLPLALQSETEFMARERIATCELFSIAVMEEAQNRGFEARLSFGVVIAAPYSQSHSWVEILVDGEWIKIDPLMARALQSTGACTADDWPHTLSPAGLYHRLGDVGPIACHDGMACDLSLRAKVRT